MLWEQAVERRNKNVKSKDLKPVFLWVDESQYFLNEQDMMYQTTARESKACTVFITQNISNYYAVMGGNRYRERVDSLLGNLGTKIFHANNDAVTNEWAAKTISQTFQTKPSMNIGGRQSSNEQKEKKRGVSTSISEVLNYQVQPYDFTILKGGGKANDYRVSAYITTMGKVWSNGKNYAPVFFNQEKKDSLIDTHVESERGVGDVQKEKTSILDWIFKRSKRQKTRIKYLGKF